MEAIMQHSFRFCGKIGVAVAILAVAVVVIWFNNQKSQGPKIAKEVAVLTDSVNVLTTKINSVEARIPALTDSLAYWLVTTPSKKTAAIAARIKRELETLEAERQSLPRRRAELDSLIMRRKNSFAYKIR